MKVGDREVVYSTGIIVPKNEEAQIEFDYSDEIVPVRIRFKQENEAEETSSSIEAELVDGQLKLTFVNWDNPIGTATTEPMELGKFRDGRSLSLMVASWAVGTISKMDIQFLVGGPE